MVSTPFAKTRTTSDTPAQAPGESASALIDAKIRELADWRCATLAHLRKLMHEAAPGVVEEVKWGVPVWSHAGILCTGETYKQAVKMPFAKGASLRDPSGLLYVSLEGNTPRAIDVHEGEAINGAALKALFRAVADFNDCFPLTRKIRAKPVKGNLSKPSKPSKNSYFAL